MVTFATLFVVELLICVALRYVVVCYGFVVVTLPRCCCLPFVVVVPVAVHFALFDFTGTLITLLLFVTLRLRLPLLLICVTFVAFCFVCCCCYTRILIDLRHICCALRFG